MIPCENCLVLAACKNKKELNCEILYQWVEKQEDKAAKAHVLSKIFSSFVIVNSESKASWFTIL